MLDICKIKDDQAREIARQFCRNRGHNPDTETDGTGIMGNSLRQPLWHSMLPQVWAHLNMAAAVQSVLGPEEPVVSGPGEPSEEERGAVHAAIRDTLSRAVRDNDFLAETLRRRAERSAASTALSIQEEADNLMSRTPAGVAAHFFPTPAEKILGPIRKTYAPVEAPREQLVLEEVLRRISTTHRG